MSSDFRLFVFDWDGTLMDSEARIVECVSAAINDLGLPERTSEEIRNIIGLGLHESMVTLFPSSEPSVHEAMATHYRYHFLSGDRTPSRLFPGVRDMLADLNDAGFQLAVATGKSRRGLDRALSETDCAAFFATSRCADETRSKPHPQMLHEIMDELEVEPGETLMVGDTEYDLQMAHEAGTSSLAVCYGVHARERLEQWNPLACVDSITGLRQWFGV